MLGVALVNTMGTLLSLNVPQQKRASAVVKAAVPTSLCKPTSNQLLAVTFCASFRILMVNMQGEQCKR